MQEYRLSGFRILEYDELESTNSEAARLRWNELEDRMVILTYRQTHGKGQVGNRWESEPGKNISMTVVFKPEALLAGEQFAMSMVIALGARDFLSRYVEDVSVKWPNDVYAGERKIAGILIEHTVVGKKVAFSFCGIGLNVNQYRFLSDAPNPVSLVQLTGKEKDLTEALAELLSAIGRRYEQVYDYDKLEKDFVSGLYRREGMFRWRDGQGTFEASVLGINEYGQLLLRDTEGKERIYGFKEVAYL